MAEKDDSSMTEKHGITHPAKRPKSDIGRPVRRQVSFQLSRRHDTEPDQLHSDYRTRPVVRQCSFQRGQPGHHAELDSKHKNIERTGKKQTQADLLPELMKKFKAQLGCKAFIANTRIAIDKKKRLELAEPEEERQWMKGNEMQAFYHTWQTSEDHIKDQSFRPRTVKRYNSLPRDFRMTESAKLNTEKKSKKDLFEFGMVRECCTRPRMRIPTFMDHEAHENH